MKRNKASMAKETSKKAKNASTAQKVGIGVGITAAALAAAGTYFLYGSKNAPKNRKVVKSWALKAKAEVLEALEKAENITEDEYNALIEMIGGAYGKVQGATKNEIAEFKKEMKGHWNNIRKSGIVEKVSGAAGASKKTSKKAPAKKATTAKKTTAKKAAPKKSAPAKKAAPKKAA